MGSTPRVWKEISGHHHGGNGLRFAAAGQRVLAVAQERIVAGQLLERVIVALEFFVRVYGVGDAGEAAAGRVPRRWTGARK